MQRRTIPLESFDFTALQVWNHWFLLTAGDFSTSQFNSMTISWGSSGVMWNKPFVQVVVRHSRYTFQFIDRYSDFTLCAFPQKYKETLSMMGSVSGRDTDKIKASGLTPIALSEVDAPGYDEAELIIKCRKIYYADFDPSHFLANYIEREYKDGDYHRSYFGEIIAVESGDTFYHPR
jgi:flavin reductase (DIM6/NTAB) family NADH-FMN oxidoreductase RutF